MSDRETGSVSKNWQDAGAVFREMSGFQAQLADIYRAFEDRTQSPRVKLLLDLLIGRAQECGAALADLGGDAGPDVLASRIQFRTTQTPRALLGAACDIEAPTVDDITDVATRANDYFGETFQGLIAAAEAGGNRSLKEVFENAWAMEQEAQVHLARQINSLDDF